MPDAARNVPSAMVQIASAYHLPYPDDGVDTVICCEVLEHLDEPDRALAEIARVAARHVVLSVPREPLWRLFRRLSHSVTLRRIEGRVTFGLDDPAATGQAYGLVLAIAALLGRRVSLQIQPDFLGPSISGKVTVRLLVWPVVIIWAALVFGTRLGIVWFLARRNYRRRLRRLEGSGPAPSPAA